MTTPVVVPKPLKKKFAKKSTVSQGALLGCFKQLRVDWRDNSLRARKLGGRVAKNGADVWEARVTKGDRVTFYWVVPRSSLRTTALTTRFLASKAVGVASPPDLGSLPIRPPRAAQVRDESTTEPPFVV